MGDSKFFAKCKPLELRAEISEARKKPKPQARVRVILKKILANVILSRSDLVVLMPDVIRLMAIDNYEIRLLCSHYIVQFAPVSKEALDALDFYARFAEERDVHLRILATKTTTLVNLPDFVKLGIAITKRLIRDTHSGLRSAAASAVARLYQHDADRTKQAGLVELLNNLLYEDDADVVASALAALSTIVELSPTLKLAIDKDHSLLLLGNLGKVNEWKRVYLLNAVMSFVPQTSDEAIEILGRVLPSLSDDNCAVVINAVKVVAYLSNYIRAAEHVFPTLTKAIGLSLVTLMSKPPEIQFLVLRNVILLLLAKRYLVEVDVRQFFWEYDDPIYIKDTKLEIIFLLANEQNVDVVFGELQEYATEVDVNMARKAVRAFGNLAVKLTSAAHKCVAILIDLLSNGILYIVQEAAVVLKNILRKYKGTFDYVIEHLMQHYEIVEEVEAKSSVVWILGQFSRQIENAQLILEYYLLTFDEEPLEVQYALLTATIKFYTAEPVVGEALVLKVLKYATERTDNPDLRDRGFLYWRMITNEASGGTGEQFQKLTKEVVINTNPLITSENINIDPAILEELELNIGTLASVYLKSVKHVFRLAKPKLLLPSPCLQPPRPDDEQSINLATGEPVETPRKVSAHSYQDKPLPSITSQDNAQSSEGLKFGRKLTQKVALLRP